MPENLTVEDLQDMPTIHEAINGLLADYMSNRPDQQFVAEFRGVAGLSQGAMSVVLPNGDVESIRSIRLLTHLFRRLRQVMATEHGTWYSVKLIAPPGQAAEMTFNYDDPPEWAHELPDEAFIEDAKMYPRPNAELPDWHPAKT